MSIFKILYNLFALPTPTGNKYLWESIYSQRKQGICSIQAFMETSMTSTQVLRLLEPRAAACMILVCDWTCTDCLREGVSCAWALGWGHQIMNEKRNAILSILKSCYYWAVAEAVSVQCVSYTKHDCCYPSLWRGDLILLFVLFLVSWMALATDDPYPTGRRQPISGENRRLYGPRVLPRQDPVPLVFTILSPWFWDGHSFSQQMFECVHTQIT